MRFIIIFLTVLSFTTSLTADEVYNPSLTTKITSLPNGLLEGKPGTYIVTVTSKAFQVTKKISMEFMVPEGVNISNKAPLIIFYHGNTKNQLYYKEGNNLLKEKALKYKFILLCPQQWWSLSGGDVQGSRDSSSAVNFVLNTLNQKKQQIYNPSHVFVTGFSAGGFAAFLTFMDSMNHYKDPVVYNFWKEYHLETAKNEGVKLPSDFDVYQASFLYGGSPMTDDYEYRGLGCFKGNFYNGVMGFPVEIEDWVSHYQFMTKDKVIYVSVGGKSDTVRVQAQAPEMREFLEGYLGLTIHFKKYPQEGHSLTKVNWKDFWDLVQANLQLKP